MYGQNLFDKRYLTQVGSFIGFPTGAPNEPRRLGVQLRYDF